MVLHVASFFINFMKYSHWVFQKNDDFYFNSYEPPLGSLSDPVGPVLNLHKIRKIYPKKLCYYIAFDSLEDFLI